MRTIIITLAFIAVSGSAYAYWCNPKVVCPSDGSPCHQIIDCR